MSAGGDLLSWQNATSGEREAFIAAQGLFRAVPKSEISAIVNSLELKEYGPGDYLVREGTIGEGLYIMWRGKAAVPPSQGESLERTTTVLQEGDFFGQPGVGPGGLLPPADIMVHKADVMAITPVTCLLLCHKDALPLAKFLPWAAEPANDDVPAVVQMILQVENLEVDLTRAVTPPEGNLYARIFGGQLLGQALATAFQSVNPSLMVHSLHSYFLVAGDPRVPVVYRVERIRDGTSFATRHVVGLQKGRNIFSMHASFQRAESGLEHQTAMPTGLPPPEQVPSWEALQQQYHYDPRIPMSIRERHAGRPPRTMPIDLRFCDPVDRVEPGKRDARQLVWMKARGRLDDNPALHRCVMAYASDFTFLETALLPHGISTPNPKMVMASLDHCMWFHRPFRADEWLLYETESPRSSGSRGFCAGRIYTRTGELVVSVAQEGLIRVAIPKRVESHPAQAPIAMPAPTKPPGTLLPSQGIGTIGLQRCRERKSKNLNGKQGWGHGEAGAAGSTREEGPDGGHSRL